MKKILLIASLLLSSSALADSYLDKLEVCSQASNTAVEYTIFAAATPDDKISEFQKFVQTQVDLVATEGEAKTLAFIANVAWKFRKTSPLAVGTAIYRDCVKSLGTST